MRAPASPHLQSLIRQGSPPLAITQHAARSIFSASFGVTEADDIGMRLGFPPLVATNSGASTNSALPSPAASSLATSFSRPGSPGSPAATFTNIFASDSAPVAFTRSLKYCTVVLTCSRLIGSPTPGGLSRAGVGATCLDPVNSAVRPRASPR